MLFWMRLEILRIAHPLQGNQGTQGVQGVLGSGIGVSASGGACGVAAMASRACGDAKG